MKPGHHVLRVTNSMAGFEDAALRLRAVLDDHEVAGRLRFHTELVFEEVVTNVIRYGGAHHIDVALTLAEQSLEMMIEDDGQPFDPLKQPDPTPPASLEAAPIGGLGIMLVRKSSSRLHYERTADARNRLVVTIAG